MDPPTHPWLSLLVLNLAFLVFLLSTCPTSAASSISFNQTLSGNQTLSSAPSGNFTLGFFSPNKAEPRNYYIGIWYGRISQSQRTVVWVANREVPVSDPSTSELRIADDGNLVLLNQSRSVVWSTNATAIAANSTVAELLDTGNLVLRDGSNSSRVLWQSIDNPTDHWLPGGKVGLNKVTRQNQRLTSWKNSEDPAPGVFSLEIDPNGTSQYLIQWNQSRVFWTSGTWNGQIFSRVPEMTADFVYDFQYINTSQENYFTYSMKPSSSLVSRFVMDLSGQIKQLTWVDNAQQWILFWSQPRPQCDVYMLCGPFGICSETREQSCSCPRGFLPGSQSSWDLSDRTGGCTRRTPLQICAGNSSSVINGDQDKFLQMDNIKLPDNGQDLPAASSIRQCESSCLSNCSCTAYSFNSSACSLWHGALTNLQELGDGGDTLYLRLAASELPDSKSNKGKIIGAGVGAAVVVLAALVLAWALVWRQRRRRFRALRVVDGAPVSFRYGDLRRVTKNFSHKLGGGGFGSVFKGTMPDSTELAIKKLEGITQGEKQFRTEVSTIGTIQHVNLVRLRGFCSEGTRRLLVYDYMPMGSLDTVLFRSSSPVVGWKTRYQIILGTARGLAYLHEKCRDCIIHCDIKPENILLDASFVPKVADFGLAKLVGRDFSRVLTTMRGTRGYLAPEWISGVAITAKADVYSFGMMVFEIVSGRRNSEPQEEARTGFFPSWAASRLREGDVLSTLDPRLKGDASLEELERVWRVAIWCVQDDESSRPSMGQVVQILEGVVDVNMPPMPRSLQLLGERPDENIVFFSSGSSHGSSQVPSSNISSSSQSKSITSASSRD